MRLTREQSQAFFLGALVSALPGTILALTYSVRFAGDLGDFLKRTVSGWVAAPVTAIVMVFLFVLILGIASAAGGFLLVLFVRLIRSFS